jgi:UDP-N-acetylglucosamine 4,6-dehydratase/5-epimerase
MRIFYDRALILFNQGDSMKDPVAWERKEDFFHHRRILITGGTGSFGKEILKRLLTLNPDRVRIVSRDEKKQHDMALQYVRDSRVQFMVGDVRDAARMQECTSDTDIVIHAAALKQVPSCEFSPMEAVCTNILGAANVRRAAVQNGVKVVTAISTDKAVEPVSVMGMTKAIQERVFLNVSPRDGQTRFVCVRFGNLVSSRGSVVPIFLKRVRAGVSLPITNTAMTRFLLTMEEAVDLVLSATAVGVSGDLWVKKLPSTDIMTLAQAVAFGVTGKDEYPIDIIGSRPGEKLHEVLATADEMEHSEDHGGFYSFPRWTASRPIELEAQRLESLAEYGSYNCRRLDLQEVVALLRTEGCIVPEGYGIGPNVEGA